MTTRLQQKNLHHSADIGVISAGLVGLWTSA